MIESPSGIQLLSINSGSDPACPFHPPKRLEGSTAAHQYALTHIPIKEGLDYISVDLTIEGPISWRLQWDQAELLLGFVDKNWAKLTVESRDIDKLESGQWFRSSGNELVIDRTSNQGLRFHLILCSREITQLLLELDPEMPHPLLKDFAGSGTPLALTSGQMNAACRAAANAIAQTQPGGIRHRLQLEANILTWIAEALNQSATALNQSISAINAVDRDAIDAITQQIQKNPGQEYSLTELCEIGGINEHKLKSAFKSIHGKTAFTYLRETRMDYAAQLLRDDRLSVIQVANEVGYSNASHFARAFKERHSLLPKAFQCLHRL